MNIEPDYKIFEGWNTDITGIKSFDGLPEKMKIYITYLNETLKIPVKFISNGPGSDQLIVAS
jgi:adenylosuccinate synthase